jgi:hypothetical protein
MRRLFLLCSLSCLILAGCNQTETTSQPAPVAPAKTAAAPPAPAKVPDLEFELLTQQQIDLYKEVMKAAAEKRRAVSDPSDMKALEFDAKIAADFKAHPNRPFHKYTPEEEAMFKRADQLHYLDNDVAKARGTFELYQTIRNAIEGMIGPHKCTNSDCGEGIPEDDPKLRQEQLAEDKRRKAIVKQDLELLKPQQAELLSLMKQVRQ